VSGLEHPERPAGVPERAAVAERPWSALWAIPIALGAVVAAGLVYVLAQEVRGAVVDLPAHRDGVYGVALHGAPPLLTFLGTLAQGLALVGGSVLAAAAALKGRVTAAHLGLRPARFWSSAAYVVAGYVLFLVIAAAWTSVMGVKDRESVAIDLGTRDSTAAFVLGGLLVCVVAPVCEELFFRGFLFGALRRHGLVVAALVSGVGFGLAHVASSPIGFIVPLATLGIILALLYERTGSLYPPMALHALNNSIAFGVGDGRTWAIPLCFAVAALCLYGLSRAVSGQRGWRTVVPTA
jgi:membrane protease YdiL (CAAX protease family)